MKFLDYYLKACNVLESCQTLEQCATAREYLLLLRKKFPFENSVVKLLELLSIKQNNVNLPESTEECD